MWTATRMANLKAEWVRMHHEGYSPSNHRLTRIEKALAYLRGR